MSFDDEVMTSFVIVCVVSILFFFYLKRKYRSEKKSTRYLQFKVSITLAAVTFSVIIFLQNDLSLTQKIIIAGVALIGGILYAVGMVSTRRTLSRILGPSYGSEAEEDHAKKENKKEDE